MPEYRNSDMLVAITEYVHNSQHREVLRLRFCEGHTYEQISGIVCYSPQHIKRICKQYKALLVSRL